LTRSPLMYTSRPSRMESRYCAPVRIMTYSMELSGPRLPPGSRASSNDGASPA
jgi:hypothetical protein